VIASGFRIPGASYIVATGAMTAMLGVLLNLLLGLSRVLLAMGRRGDMPAKIATLNAARTTPYVAVIAIAALISTLTLVGNVKTTWSFSAFTVLIYYSVTNLAALMIPPQHRLYPQWLAWVGMFGCLFLAFWVEWQVWTAGLAIIGIGLAWHGIAQRKVSKDAMFRRMTNEFRPSADSSGDQS
jgi:APA family basic amino acid/polyamine antiporter